MVRWPDDESMLKEYVDELGYSEAASHCGWLRQFQRFVRQHSPHRGLTERVFRTWIRKKAEKSSRSFVIRQTQFIKGFLDWLDRGESCRAILWMICKGSINADRYERLPAL